MEINYKPNISTGKNKIKKARMLQSEYYYYEMRHTLKVIRVY